MTEFLVRTFVRGYEDTQSPEVRTRYGTLASVVGIVCNALLFAVKITIGLVMGSIAVVADAFNNLSDAASTVIGLVGIKMAEKPANSKHPFGYGRMEYIAAFIVAFLVIEVGFSLFRSSVGRIGKPEDLSFELFPFLFLLLSVAVKLWLGFFNRNIGRRIDSKVMMAAAADSLGDSLSTGVTVLSVLIFQVTGLDVDAWAGLVVSLFVMAAGVKISKETLEPLLGEPAGRELYQSITELMWSFEGVEDVYDLIIHSYGPNRSMASARVAVSREMDIEQAHELIEQIERYVFCRLGVHLVIHVDPVEVQDEYILRTRGRVAEIVEQIDPRLEMHDFRLSVEDGYTDVSFRLLVPHDYDQKRQDTVEFDILRQINRMEGRYLCVITMDRSYVADTGAEED